MFTLLDEQQVAYDLVLQAVAESRRANTKKVVIVTGGPGTGKSIIALQLVATLAKQGRNVCHATGSKAFTTTLRKLVGSRAGQLFRYWNLFGDAEPNELDVVVADEAHRLRAVSSNRFTPKHKISGLPQVDEIIQVARVPVFLLDEHQVVRPEEIGTVATIRQAAARNGADVLQVDLNGQFRCAGSAEYIAWVDALLCLDGSRPRPWPPEDPFDLTVVDTPEELQAWVRERAQAGHTARLSAGFCWPWSDPAPDGILVEDVQIGSWRLPWNAKPGKKPRDAPPAALWATDPGGRPPPARQYPWYDGRWPRGEQAMLRETDVVVIGGGATGTAVLWDLALRGIEAVLVDRSDLGTGTSGRWHGELHSGARYAVADQRSAHECVEENAVLRRVAPHAIEDTGGLLILLPEHDLGYGDRFVTGCAETGVPCEEVDPATARREEPALTDRIERAFWVPTDGSMDSWRLLWSMAHGAEARGGRVLVRHPVVGFERDGDGRVSAVRVHDLVGGREQTIGCRWVINAAGPWAGRIGAMAGAPFRMVPDMGTMVVMADRYVRSLVTHCRWPTDGDIIVPAYDAAILGTTSSEADDPDDPGVAPREIDLIIDQTAKLVPAIANGRVLRAYSGYRPLYDPVQGEAGGHGRSISRTFTVLDHEPRDGVPNLLSIVGGKLTTSRMMAEKVVDVLVAKRGEERPCTTATTALPGAEQGIRQPTHPLARPSAGVGQADGPLACECELITRRTIEEAVGAGVTRLDDLRRQYRLGFGPSQGGGCGWRAAAVVAARRPDVGDPLGNLRLFMQERWRGLRAVAWGQAAVQALRNDAIYRGILALDTVEREPGEDEQIQAAATGDDWSGPRQAGPGRGVGGEGLTGDTEGRRATDAGPPGGPRGPLPEPTEGGR